jgi:hypothetical protein
MCSQQVRSSLLRELPDTSELGVGGHCREYGRTGGGSLQMTGEERGIQEVQRSQEEQEEGKELRDQVLDRRPDGAERS